jgi:hypothetical protein
MYKRNTNIRYRAQIYICGKAMFIGYFQTSYEAAENWDACARKKGRTNKLNFPLNTNLSHIKLPDWI